MSLRDSSLVISSHPALFATRPTPISSISSSSPSSHRSRSRSSSPSPHQRIHSPSQAVRSLASLPTNMSVPVPAIAAAVVDATRTPYTPINASSRAIISDTPPSTSSPHPISPRTRIHETSSPTPTRGMDCWNDIYPVPGRPNEMCRKVTIEQRLIFAVMYLQTARVQSLLTSPSTRTQSLLDINHTWGVAARTPLNMICSILPSADANNFKQHQDDFIAITRELLQAPGVDLETRDMYHRTPLLNAIYTKRPPLVYLLLEHGANIDAIDRNGRGVLEQQYENQNLQTTLQTLIDEESQGKFELRKKLGASVPVPVPVHVPVPAPVAVSVPVSVSISAPGSTPVSVSVPVPVPAPVPMLEQKTSSSPISTSISFSSRHPSRSHSHSHSPSPHTIMNHNYTEDDAIDRPLSTSTSSHVNTRSIGVQANVDPVLSIQIQFLHTSSPSGIIDVASTTRLDTFRRMICDELSHVPLIQQHWEYVQRGIMITTRQEQIKTVARIHENGIIHLHLRPNDTTFSPIPTFESRRMRRRGGKASNSNDLVDGLVSETATSPASPSMFNPSTGTTSPLPMTHEPTITSTSHPPPTSTLSSPAHQSSSSSSSPQRPHPISNSRKRRSATDLESEIQHDTSSSSSSSPPQDTQEMNHHDMREDESRHKRVRTSDVVPPTETEALIETESMIETSNDNDVVAQHPHDQQKSE